MVYAIAFISAALGVFADYEIAKLMLRLVRHAWAINRIAKRVQADPANVTYTDLAMTPVNDDDTENLEMFTHNASARDEVVRSKKIRALQGNVEAAE